MVGILTCFPLDLAILFGSPMMTSSSSKALTCTTLPSYRFIFGQSLLSCLSCDIFSLHIIILKINSFPCLFQKKKLLSLYHDKVEPLLKKLLLLDGASERLTGFNIFLSYFVLLDGQPIIFLSFLSSPAAMFPLNTSSGMFVGYFFFFF